MSGLSWAGGIHFKPPLPGSNTASSEAPFLAHQGQWGFLALSGRQVTHGQV